MDTWRTGQFELMLQRVLQLQLRIIEKLELVEGPIQRDWYTPAEMAEITKRKSATIRGWCRNRRLEARKRAQGRGDKLGWEISAKELQRYRDHGLLPIRTNAEPSSDQM